MNNRLHANTAVGERVATLAMDISSTTIIAGALASRDYSPLHHDYHYVTDEAGHRDIFLNTPHQANLFERYLSDWSGPRGRLGRMRFTMTASVYAGDNACIDGEVVDCTVDETGCGWVKLRLTMSVDGKVSTECEARYALPMTGEDDPWTRRGEEWQP